MTPVVETERLILRGRRRDDFPAYAAIWAMPQATRFTSGVPLSAEDAWTKFARMEGFWSLCGYGFWIVEEKASGDLVGEVGLADFRRDIHSAFYTDAEFGWLIAPKVEGRGYATEALRASLDWALKNIRQTAYSCIIDPKNAASIRVAGKCGFSFAATSAYKGKEISLFRWAQPGDAEDQSR